MTATDPQRTAVGHWRVAGVLFTLTFLSTTTLGAWRQGANPWSDGNFGAGLAYSVPLMAILLCHEFGHYIAARIHRVPVSPPFFVPMPLGPFGTMGAVILMPDRIARRDALLDIGAAGPLAGLVVAIPVLVYGLWQSPVEALNPELTYFAEGHSLLYAGLLYLTKGPIPTGHDVMLSETAFAGWTGLFVTMLNLIPAVQLDGGHVAYALLGEGQQAVSRTVRRALLPMGIAVALAYGMPSYLAGASDDAVLTEASAGVPWFLWFGVLHVMARFQKNEHPPTDPGHLSPARRRVAVLCLVLFGLLFMPAWLREIPGSDSATSTQATGR